MSEFAPPSTAEKALPISDEQLMALGGACIEAAQRSDLQEVAAAHQELIDNPNSHGPGFFVGQGEVPMTSDNVYRQVGIEAIEDLASSGIVRNGATAAGSEHRRWGHRVFWNDGAEGRAMSAGGRFVIEAPKAAAEAGWVTADKVTGIHTQMSDGTVKNILGLR